MANDYIPRQVFQTLAYSRVQIPISCNATPHLPPRTHSHTYLTAESKICSGMIAIIISDQLCYWTKAAVVPLAWEWLFCEGICGLVPPGWMWWMGGKWWRLEHSQTLPHPRHSIITVTTFDWEHQKSAQLITTQNSTDLQKAAYLPLCLQKCLFLASGLICRACFEGNNNKAAQIELEKKVKHGLWSYQGSSLTS